MFIPTMISSCWKKWNRINLSSVLTNVLGTLGDKNIRASPWLPIVYNYFALTPYMSLISLKTWINQSTWFPSRMLYVSAKPSNKRNRNNENFAKVLRTSVNITTKIPNLGSFRIYKRRTIHERKTENAPISSCHCWNTNINLCLSCSVWNNLKPCSDNWQKLIPLLSYAKMIKNYSKQFGSTDTFSKYSTIIFKLVWPEDTNLYFEKYLFQNQTYFPSKNVGGAHN